MPNQVYSLTGNDTLSLYDRVFTSFADDSIIEITYPNDLVVVKTGKNANTIYAKDEQGNNATMSLRIMRGSSDDKFLMTKFNQLKTDVFAQFVLATGTFVKMLGDGAGNVTYDTYVLQGGIFTKQIEVASNVNGDTVQGVSIYSLKFALGQRSLA